MDNAIDYENNPLHRWMAFFDKTSSPELIEKITSMDSAIKAANDRLIELSKDEEFMRLYHLREKVLKERREEADRNSPERPG